MAFLSRVRIVGRHRGSVNRKALRPSHLDRADSCASVPSYGTIVSLVILYKESTTMSAQPLPVSTVFGVLIQADPMTMFPSKP